MKQSTILKEQMKDDLMRVYREVSSQYCCRHQEEAYEQAVMHEAPRFYVDSRWASQRIAPLCRGDHNALEKMNPLTRQMYEELFAVVQRLYQEEKYWGKSLSYVLRFAVQEPASRFFISKERMGQIWRERTAKKRQRDQKMYGESKN